ncbi:MAG: SRPBCC family protein [Gammaproteobacteria bacterium]
MDLNDQQVIEAPRDRVYAALNDPEVLQACIPGCRAVTKISDTELEAEMGLKIGPVKATFKTLISLTNLNPPESYTLVGEGKAGAAGFAKGSADVKLTEDGDRTVLEYGVQANVGGKMAQVGGRLMESTTRKLAADFFKKFSEVVQAAA